MFNIHNDRELVLLRFLNEECMLCSFLVDDNIIGKINGIISSLYMLDIIDEPMIINNYYEANELKKSIQKYLLEKQKRRYTRRGSDTLALIENRVADYNTPQYNSIDEYLSGELSLLSMQIENLKRKVEFLRTGEF